MLLDAEGIEWELYDDSALGAGAVLMDWDYGPQEGAPALYFVSSRDLRRLWPAPDRWWELGEAELFALLERATSL